MRRDEEIFAGDICTDTANAQRFQNVTGGWVRFVPIWNRWLMWDGKRWRSDDLEEVYTFASDAVCSIYREASMLEDEKERKRLASWATRSESATAIKNMLFLAARRTGITLRPEDLDKNGWLLNCENGTIDLRTGKLRSPHLDDFITKLAPTVYDPAATCPRFERFLLEIMANRPDLVAFLKRAIGYSACGDTRERKLFILHGTGRNGKSTLLSIVNEALGDYALKTHAGTFLTKRDGGIPNDVARLNGARFVYASESAEGKKLDEALVKELTGREPISARFMRAEWFQFVPEFKPWLGTNHRPEIEGTDLAIWDRVDLIPFDVRFTPHEEAGDMSTVPTEDKNLMADLRKELPGILRWIVEGCLEWLRIGLAEPPAVKAATAEYREEMDRLEEFLSTRCLISINARCYAGDLVKAYSGWCQENGCEPLAVNSFAAALKDRGFKRKRKGQKRMWCGLAILDHRESVEEESETCQG